MKWATLGRRRYKVWHDATVQGFTDLGGQENVIYVDPNLGPVDHLTVACHEAQHALNPEWSEAQVEKAGKQLQKFLRGLGYRRTNG